MPGTVWLHCFSLLFGIFSPRLNHAFLGFVDGWCSWVGGMSAAIFYACPFLYFQNSSNFTGLSFPSQSKWTLT